MNYNTERNDIEMREYGRHLQKMVDYAITLEDRTKRQKVAETIIHLMSTLNPQLRSTADYKQKLWDHLFVVSKFKLDVDSPYPIPTEETARIKPANLPYPQQKIKLKHYGKNVEALVEKAKNMDEDKKATFTEIIGNFMKMAYKNWSNEEVSNELIKEDMKFLSAGELAISAEMNIENMSRNQQQQRRFPQNNRNNNNRNNNNRNNNNRNNNNNNRNNNNRNNNNNNRNNNNRFNKNQ